MKQENTVKKATALGMLQEMDARREAQQQKLEDSLRRLDPIIEASVDELQKIDPADPALIIKSAAVQYKVDVIFDKYNEIQEKIQQYKLKNVPVATNDETESFVRIAKKGFLLRMLNVANRMLDLETELESLSKEAEQIEYERYSLFCKWNKEVSNGYFPESIDSWVTGYFDLSHFDFWKEKQIIDMNRNAIHETLKSLQNE